MDAEPTQTAPPRSGPARLTRAVVEIEQHAATRGWDQPARLFALVPTADLLAAQPELAAQGELAAAAGLDPGHLTPVEQEDLPPYASLEELLGGLAWPDGVLGAAITVERVMLPPDAEGEMPQEESEALRWVAEHPQRQEVRLAVGVLRDGSRECALRMRAHDTEDAVLSGADLVPGLAEALAETFRD